MARWTCPDCKREFGRNKQSHECAPAMSLDEYFSTGPERERPIYEAVKAHLDTLGPVIVEPVSVGIFLKKTQNFCQLRPRDRWVAMSFSLPRREQHPRINRKVQAYNGRFWHVADLRTPDDLDDQLKEWLTEAYFESPE